MVFGEQENAILGPGMDRAGGPTVRFAGQLLLWRSGLLPPVLAAHRRGSAIGSSWCKAGAHFSRQQVRMLAAQVQATDAGRDRPHLLLWERGSRYCG